MQIVDQGLIFDAARRPPQQRVTAFTGLCPLESGTILASFQMGPAKHAPESTIGLCRSHDRGQTWGFVETEFSRHLDGVPGSLTGGEMVEVQPGRLMLCTTWFDRSDPARPLFDPVTEGILHSRQLRCYSNDEGDTWSAWEEIPVGDLRGCSLTGPLLRWSDGTIAFPFESYKEYDDLRPHRHGAWLVVSHDDGRTFSSPRCVAQHPQGRVYYWDQRLCALPNSGEYLAMFWTHDLQLKQDLCVHLRRGNAMETGGAPDEIRPTQIPGQIAAPAVMNDGRWLAFVVDRGNPGTLKLWVSEDEGATWPPDKALCVYTHDRRAISAQAAGEIDYVQYWDDMLQWTFGHPAIRVIGDRTALVSFYAGSPGVTSIHWARVEL